MQSKLTLSLDKNVIEKAKYFAKASNRSLSEIVETYLKNITDAKDPTYDKELDEVSGIIALPLDFDEKVEMRKIMATKHL